MAKKIDKTIVVLNDFEHVRKRPTMYVGSVDITEERVPVIKNKRLISINRQISVGYYKLMNEILDNAFDEAKRMDGKMKAISIAFNTKTNEVTVIDTGNGFDDPVAINPKSGLSNVETAMSMLKAGSNFDNDDIDEALLGTNGVGAAIVNMLSSKFYVKTTNKDWAYEHEWKDFKTILKKDNKKKRSDKLGTTISFIPSKEIFKKAKWDVDYIVTLMKLKKILQANNPDLQKIKFELKIDDKIIDLSSDFLTEDTVRVDFKYGYILLMPHLSRDFYPTEFNYGTTDISFVNTAQCVGMHERIIDEWLAELFNYKYSYKYVDKIFVLNLPPKFVSFGDQNKTRYAPGRWIIEPILDKHLKKAFKRGFNKKTSLFIDTKRKIDEHIANDEMKFVKNEKKRKKSKAVANDKFFPPSSRTETLFIVEGKSAMGGILQRRNSKTDGAYALRGKIKVPRTIRDLGANAEILDLMNILQIDPKSTAPPAYKKIVIATDADPDGDHIASILINLFYKWFPQVVSGDHLFKLIAPLVSSGVGKNMQYFYSLPEFQGFEAKNKTSNIRYLKGLGSMSPEDWEWLMNQRRLFRVYADRSAPKYLDIAFGGSSKKRKEFLKK